MIIVEVGAGLGNQMFGYAFGKALSLKHNDTFFITKRRLKKDSLRKFGLNHFSLIKKDLLLENHPFLYSVYYIRIILKKISGIAKINFKKEHIHSVHDTLWDRSFVEIPYEKNKINIYRGIYQCDKYFDEYRDELINDFTVIDDLSAEEKKLESEILNSQSVCLHIRRGDYLSYDLFSVCTLSYYQRAIDIMKDKKPDVRFFVFSDDIAWVKENIIIPDAVYIEKTQSDYIDLHLMMTCKNFIISNSTFSWWAQYLSKNEDKTVIAPNTWLKDEKPLENSIFQNSWLCITPFE